VYKSQYAALQAASFVSPLLAARSFSMGLAGTDLWHHRDFADAAEAYRRKWVKRLNDDLTYNSRTGDFSYKVGRSFWEATEDFRYTPPEIATVLHTQRWSLLLLMGWFLISHLFAIWAVGRMSAIEEA
jgi:ABC-2 type transport system permease protein